MARTSAKAKKQKQDVNKTKPEETDTNDNEKQEVNPNNDNEDTNGSTDKENDNSNYEVEKIVHTRVYHGKRQFLVRWKGYKEDNDTWENESVLQSCSEVLDAFKLDNPKLIEKVKEESDSESDEESNAEKGKKRTKKRNKKPANKKAKKRSKSKTEVTLEKEDEDKSDSEDVDVKKKVSKGAKKDLSKSKQETKESPDKNRKFSEKDDDDDDSVESVTDGKNYEVEKILEVHTRKNGSREFLIRWKGYRPSDDTWEPEEHLDCPDLIERFMEKVDKAKSVPARELRESRTPTKRYVPNNRGQHRTSQRQGGVRSKETSTKT
ncbi:heterochromatin protein 1-like isoform X1 [Homalodisca vitripennis]|uniref:heterochromatin protein 1-like isoform X1 n=1 Tax=Homalodisca vitripennis TaxID=197043 RepID=UPI001EEC15E1|nr:heterochromatin protein 1-like isoform X1 [Homalodisca vitripennis]